MFSAIAAHTHLMQNNNSEPSFTQIRKENYYLRRMRMENPINLVVPDAPRHESCVISSLSKISFKEWKDTVIIFLNIFRQESYFPRYKLHTYSHAQSEKFVLREFSSYLVYCTTFSLYFPYIHGLDMHLFD